MRTLPAIALLLLTAACAQAPAATQGGRLHEERPPAVAASDLSLKEKVAARLLDLDRRLFRAVTVEAWEGRVLLMGAVVKPEQRRRLEQLARSVDGVTQVHNEVLLAEEKLFDGFAPDIGRERAVTAALAGDPDLTRVSATVRVVNGVVYLLGSAPSAAEADKAKEAALDLEGVKWVVSYILPRP